MEKILLWCHGDCFSDGSIQDNADLRILLEYRFGWTITCVDFSLTDWTQAISDITTACTNLQTQNPSANIVLVGVSSGGMLAHTVANNLQLSAVLLCPVIKPFDRHNSLTADLQAKQLSFFHTLDQMQTIQGTIQLPNAKRYIMYGMFDNIAPVSAYEDWLTNELVAYDRMGRDHDLCTFFPITLVGLEIFKI